MNLLTRKRFLGFLAALPALSLFGADKQKSLPLNIDINAGEGYIRSKWGLLQFQEYISVQQSGYWNHEQMMLTMTRPDGTVDVFRFCTRLTGLFSYDVTRVVDPGPDIEVSEFTFEYQVHNMIDNPTRPIVHVTWRERVV